MMSDFVIYGAGGFAKEIAWLVNSEGQSLGKVVCFIDDDDNIQGRFINDIQVMSLDEAWETFPSANIVGGLGSPKARESVIRKAKEIGFRPGNVIHPDVSISKFNQVGKGVVICEGSILTTNIVIGNHVQINLDCTIGHDVVMDDFATLAPGVHVSGYVQLGRRVYIGTGANIINGTRDNPLVVGDDAVIGAGACVTGDISSGQTVVGVPARSINQGN